MAYQALYRKYRPGSFDDFIDQDNVKKILLNSILNKKISHAYLFSGPRGIGKTSMAKIFAKAINCLGFDKNHDVCNYCSNCLEIDSNCVDILEIDAASNNGVDQIRDLKNKVNIVPSKLKYKVYIIDEVHMLTNSAFNALLKTLEEPPSHVVFILATTEFYEVPETIVSRCQCFNFSRISQKSLENRLKYIAEKETIDITDDAITEIARYSNGGLRDAIGMLDKLNSFTDDKITVEVFRSINGMISFEDIEELYKNIYDKNLENVLNVVTKVNEQGYDFKNFIEREMIYVRDKIVDYYIKNTNVLGNINDNVELVNVLNNILNHLKDAVNPYVIVQIYLLKYIEEINNTVEKEPKEKQNEEKIANTDKIISREIISEQPKKIEKNQSTINSFKINQKNRDIRVNNAMATANINLKNEMLSIWKELNKYFMNDKFGKVSQLLSDSTVMVVGNNYMILTTDTDGIMNNIYQNLSMVEDFISFIYHKLNVVVLLNSDFEKVKNKYIEDKKNKITYHVQEECGKLVEESNDLINQALSVFGSDMVEIE